MNNAVTKAYTLHERLQEINGALQEAIDELNGTHLALTGSDAGAYLEATLPCKEPVNPTPDCIESTALYAKQRAHTLRDMVRQLRERLV